MNLANVGITQTNITIVYDKLDLEAIDRNALRRELVEGVAPVITEIPGEMIALVYPQLQMACLYDNHRIRLNDGSRLSIGERPTVQVAIRTSNLVTDKIIAYGFNYDVRASIEGVDDSGLFLRDRFLRHPDEVEGQVGGPIHALGFHLQYSRDNVMYQLVVEPEDGGPIKAHLNAHFGDQRGLPDAETMQNFFIQEFEGFLDTLRAL